MVSIEEEAESEETSEWVGYVKTMKIYIKKNLSMTYFNIKGMMDRQEGEIRGVRDDVKRIEDKIEIIMKKLDDK